jgi:uncharacterized membrane protein
MLAIVAALAAAVCVWRYLRSANDPSRGYWLIYALVSLVAFAVAIFVARP